jgi:predicted NBD/HSP70 family sugar kinase
MYVTRKVIPNALRQSLSRAQVPARLIEGVGADFPAPVNARGGVVLDLANLKHPEWRGSKVRDGLVEGLKSVDDLNPQMVAVDNDAAAAMYGLVQELPPAERRKVILGFFIGTGLGGAKLLNAKNSFNNEGGGTEPGATVMSFDELRYLLGKPGRASERRLEEFVSLTAIERQLPLLTAAGIVSLDHPILQLGPKEGKTDWRVRAEKVIGFADQALIEGRMDDPFLRLKYSRRP